MMDSVPNYILVEPRDLPYLEMMLRGETSEALEVWKWQRAMERKWEQEKYEREGAELRKLYTAQEKL